MLYATSFVVLITEISILKEVIPSLPSLVTRSLSFFLYLCVCGYDPFFIIYICKTVKPFKQNLQFSLTRSVCCSWTCPGRVVICNDFFILYFLCIPLLRSVETLLLTYESSSYTALCGMLFMIHHALIHSSSLF